MIRSWGDVDGEYVFKALKEVKAVEVILKNEKRLENIVQLPKSYLKLATINVNQRNYVLRVLAAMSAEQRDQLLKDSVSCKETDTEFNIKAKNASSHTDEMVRVMYLRLYPVAQMYLINSRQPM